MFHPHFLDYKLLTNNFNNTPKALDPVLIVGQSESAGNSRLAPGGSVANNRLHVVNSRRVGVWWFLMFAVNPPLTSPQHHLSARSSE